MKVLIITEGSENIGFGHVTRCTSLYEAFQDKKIIPTFIINGDDTIRPLLKDKINLISNWLDNKERLLHLIKNADIAVVDSYLADITFYNNISETVKIPIYIDDARRIDYPRGIVVNGTIYAEELNYPDKKDITYLLGSQYIPLRKEFWNVPEKKIRENIGTVMITFGGDDMRHLTPEVLKILNENFPEYNKKVVIGKGFSNIDQIESLKDKKTQLIYYPDASGMKQIMLESDIAISAGGQTLYELARIAVPTIAIAVADNQMNNIKGWQKNGFIEYAGTWDNKNLLDNIIVKMKLLQEKSIRGKKANIGKGLVDGLGSKRVVKNCLKEYFNNNITLKRADIRDIYNIFELSNDLEVRQNSFNPERIEMETHKNWFSEKINNPNCIFLVAEVNNKFLGQIRFDIDEEQAVISISIIKKYRHLDAGRIVLQEALKYLKMYYPNMRFITAYIKEENITSKNFFESLSFLYIGRKKIKDQNALEYRFDLKEEQKNHG